MLKKMSEMIKNITQVRKILSDLLQLDRLEKLAEKNSIVAMAYAEATMLINYILLTWDRDVNLQQIEIAGWVIAAKTFEPTIEGKLSAIGQAYAHGAGKIDNALSVTNFTNAMTGVGVIGDIAAKLIAAIRTPQVTQLQGLPPGFGIEMKPKLKKEKKAK